jgi:hypothetical protein
MRGESDLVAAADELTRAAALDLFGREPFQIMLFEVTGSHEGVPATRGLVLRGHDTYALTGLASALATLDVLEGRIEPGIHFASTVLDPAAVFEALRASPAVTTFEVFEAPILGRIGMEEGEL